MLLSAGPTMKSTCVTDQNLVPHFFYFKPFPQLRNGINGIVEGNIRSILEVILIQELRNDTNGIVEGNSRSILDNINSTQVHFVLSKAFKRLFRVFLSLKPGFPTSAAPSPNWKTQTWSTPNVADLLPRWVAHQAYFEDKTEIKQHFQGCSLCSEWEPGSSSSALY